MPAMPDRTLTIPASATASNPFGTGQATRGSFQLPSAMSGTTIRVQVTNEQTPANWTDCPVEGAEVNPLTPTAANGTYPLPGKTFHFRFFRLVSGTTETSERVINVFSRD